MQHISISRARSNIFKLMQEVHDSHEPVLLTGKHNNAVMVSEEDWKSIQETLYLMSVPGMTESLIEARATSLVDCDDTPPW